MKTQYLRFTGIRKKLFLYYLITTLILGVTSVYSYQNAKTILARLKPIISDHVYLNDLNNEVNTLMMEVEKYLSTKSSEALLNYYTAYSSLEKKSASFSRDATYDEDSLMLKNIGNMIDGLLIETDFAVKAKRGRISSEYIAHFTRANEISEHIKYYVNNLLNRRLQDGSEKYMVITKNMTFLSYANILVIAVSIVINTLLAIVFTYRLTKPIIELAHSAEKISKGDFNIKSIGTATNDEVDILAKAFNKMVVNIRSYIDEIKKQAEVENKLKEQEMENLKMKSLLKDAELKSLQSQINPHFLFNTLNAASQLAMMEGADKSSEFIENIAELFRYNIRKLDEPITLEEEINYVEKYMYILKGRFGSKIEFSTNIDVDVLQVKVPCTIIQPIVENAFIHGLEKTDQDGKIILNVMRVEETILIEVIDNGVGMEEEKLEGFFSNGIKNAKTHRHASGIGMHNVIERLKLFYNITDSKEIIQVESEIGKGTKVTLRIPYY
ncbi:sensor histidine kinase [Alkaliphilus peptidifermentans]|uniref:histidine kinase n=1 Tax=Alkaliphilus peptidifermentans DSM 18978 TaxID=1120976 RepID=A0A1G5FD41_9FIRM|nr:sensor histidine kinase [Alkaliphilus peptidifermentans]SCY37064.1 Histidine kinase-, DNA gyrase B-, and HSP90-like ATPase [Alkaliphilus peptidifermentans DSM 18978]